MANPITRSTVCKVADFTEPWFCRLSEKLAVDSPNLPLEQRNLHRKVWEWVMIAHTAESLNLLRPGVRALGFAVGEERLPALFASFGVDVVATDAGSEEVATKWGASNQHSQAVEDLYYSSIVDGESFARHVRFANADMNACLEAPPGPYDFLWSSCALEHLGSLDAGTQFVVDSTKLLKPGGVALHTTEYNLSSIDETLSSGETVLYRQVDLERMGARLRRIGAGLAPLDLDAGTHRYDLEFDLPPYHKGDETRKHVKLDISGYVCTSALLVAHT